MDIKYNGVTLKNVTYEQFVNFLIRRRYNLSAEIAILRQRDSKPEEYAKYYAYCEECKLKAKEIVNNL